MYIDGSLEKVTGVGYVGGYGIYSEGLHAIGAYLPTHISRGRCSMRQLGGFSMVVVIVALFLPTVCPVGGGMWGIFGKPLKRAIQTGGGAEKIARMEKNCVPPPILQGLPAKKSCRAIILAFGNFLTQGQFLVQK